MSAPTVEALARMLAEGIDAAAREIAREEGRRAALEVLDKTSGAAALPREWITQVEAARVAGCTPQTIREWLEAGHLGARGHRGKVHLERLRAYLASPSKAAPAPGRGRQIAAVVLAEGGGTR